MNKILGEAVKEMLLVLNEAVIAKDKDVLKSSLLPEEAELITDESWDSVFSAVRGGMIQQQELVSAYKNTYRSGSRPATENIIAAYEIETDNGFHLIQYQIFGDGSGYVLKSLTVNADSISFKTRNDFNNIKRTWKHFSIIFLAVIILGFILYTLYVCVRTPEIKYKWAWAFFILLGLHGIYFNWSTAEISNTLFQVSADGQSSHFSIVQFMLFGVGATKGGALAPWIVSAFFPLGAVFFWVKHRALFIKSSPSG